MAKLVQGLSEARVRHYQTVGPCREPRDVRIPDAAGNLHDSRKRRPCLRDLQRLLNSSGDPELANFSLALQAAKKRKHFGIIEVGGLDLMQEENVEIVRFQLAETR